MCSVFVDFIPFYYYNAKREVKKICINSDKLIDNNPVKTKNSRKKTIKKRKAHGNSGLCGVNTIYTA